MKRSAIGSAAALLALFGSARAVAQEATSAGSATSPHPTFEHLSLEWAIDGDDDADGVVTVRYRPEGASSWKTGLPLKRIPAASNEGFSWTNKHAGSLFGLAAGTSYEIELSLTDPDGGDVTETLVAATRAWPAKPATAPTPVDPTTLGAALADAAPGDVLLLADGVYGPIMVLTDGTAEAPIVIEAENPGGAVIDGEVRLDGRSHVQVIGLTVNAQIKFNDAENIVIRGCTIDTPADGIVSKGAGVTGALIIDNTVTGPTVWSEASFGVNGDNLGEGIQLTGPGNVIAFNRVKGFRDCISFIEEASAVAQSSFDIYGNDLIDCADDGIEADFAMGNVRVHHNRLTNTFMGISSQPNLGGPSYFVRNVLYNVVHSAFKLQRSSVGDVAFHNTVVKAGDAFGIFTTDVWARALFRNNVFIGAAGDDLNGYDTGPGRVLYLPTADESCDFDYDGFGSIGTGIFEGNVGGVTFDGLSELQTLTTEAHAIEVDLSIFAEAVSIPDPVVAQASPSLQLATAAAAVDAGTPLATINDGFAGAAPDLGAYELGQELPVYGPGGTLGSGGSGAGGAGAGGAGGGDPSGAGGGGPSAGSGAGGGASAPPPGEDGGCACRAGSRSPAAPLGLSLLVGLFAAARLRRRRS